MLPAGALEALKDEIARDMEEMRDMERDLAETRATLEKQAEDAGIALPAPTGMTHSSAVERDLSAVLAAARASVIYGGVAVPAAADDDNDSIPDLVTVYGSDDEGN